MPTRALAALVLLAALPGCASLNRQDLGREPAPGGPAIAALPRPGMPEEDGSPVIRLPRVPSEPLAERYHRSLRGLVVAPEPADAEAAYATEDPAYPHLLSDPLTPFGRTERDRDPFLAHIPINLIHEEPWSLYRSPQQAFADQIDRRTRANIRFPGPDTSNFPNSAYTLPKGRFYLESSPLTLYGPTTQSAPQYNWEFLARYGLTDNLELRLFSNGFTALGRPAYTTGFSPLAFDLKMHFWEENRRYHLPAMGVEIYLTTDFGSPRLNTGVQPAISLLFDQVLPGDFLLEYNFGIAGNPLADGLNDYQFAFQWAVEHTLFSDDFVVFTHGFFNNSALPRLPSSDAAILDINTNPPTTVVVGGGARWTLNDRWCLFGSYNAGLTPSSPTTLAYVGFAVAL
jgi:hypothetical protein